VLKVAFSSVYRYQLPEGHRFPMEKYDLLPEQLIYEGTLTENQFFEPEALSDEQIVLTHSAEYLAKLNACQLTRQEERKIGFPVRPELITRGKHISNGTLQGAKYALKYGLAMNIAGGTHHAYRDRGEGFCVFNDFAIAANCLLQEGLVSKILIVDLDVHQGNGTASIFADNKNVFTFSVHGAKNYPMKKEKSDLDIGVPDGIKDEAYLKIVEETLPRLIDQVQPSIIFYLAGVDILESDKLGRLKVTREGCKQRDWFVFTHAKKNEIPVMVSMGGGYSSKISDIIEAHANTFRVGQHIFF
jgi:acetoin utilization deacetylase AcuC-like enzyme